MLVHFTPSSQAQLLDRTRFAYQEQQQDDTSPFMANDFGRLAPSAAALVSSSFERPKLIPLVAAESGYSENSSVNILCTVSAGHHESLQFDWFKDGQPLGASVNGKHHDEAPMSHPPTGQESVHFGGTGGNTPVATLRSSSLSNTNQLQLQMLSDIQTDKHPDHSLLRISSVQAHHSGRYTCSAKSQFGQDSSSVTLRVNGE